MKNRLILAMTGTGKTTYRKEHSTDVIDLDVKLIEDKGFNTQVSNFSLFINSLLASGITVLADLHRINFDRIDPKTEVIVVVPDPNTVHSYYSKENMGKRSDTDWFHGIADRVAQYSLHWIEVFDNVIGRRFKNSELLLLKPGQFLSNVV